jgi:hypothetical protein
MMSDWSVDQLKNHLEALIDANDRRYNDRDAFHSTALRSALEANDKRLAVMNEFRAALADQSGQMLTRSENDAARKSSAERTEQMFTTLALRLDAEIKPLHAKIEESARPNWSLLVAVGSLMLGMIAGVWLIVGLKIDATVSPVVAQTEQNRVSLATQAEALRNVTTDATSSTQADMESRSDRAQLNERMRNVEAAVHSGSADRRAAEATTKSALVEIETQFKAMSDTLNFQKDVTQQWLTLLWQKTYGESLPPADFRPNLYRSD